MIYRVLAEETYTRDLLIQADSQEEARDIADEYMADVDVDTEDFYDRDVQILQELDDSANVDRSVLITKEDV